MLSGELLINSGKLVIKLVSTKLIGEPMGLWPIKKT